MNSQTDVLQIVRNLKGNAVALKKCLKEGNLPESARLTCERISLVEDLRGLKDSKVSVVNSDIKDEFNLLMKTMQEDVSEAISAIRARLSALLKELAKTKGAKKIAAYKIHGGRYGY